MYDKTYCRFGFIKNASKWKRYRSQDKVIVNHSYKKKGQCIFKMFITFFFLHFFRSLGKIVSLLFIRLATFVVKHVQIVIYLHEYSVTICRVT